MGFPDDAKDEQAEAAEEREGTSVEGSDDRPASRTQGEQGLTQPGPPSDPQNPTG